MTEKTSIIIELSSTSLKLFVRGFKSTPYQIFTCLRPEKFTSILWSFNGIFDSSKSLHIENFESFVMKNIRKELSQFISSTNDPDIHVVISTGFQLSVEAIDPIEHIFRKYFPEVTVEVLNSDREGYYSLMSSLLHLVTYQKDYLLNIDIGGKTTNVTLFIDQKFTSFDVPIGYKSFDASKVNTEDFYHTFTTQLNQIKDDIYSLFDSQHVWSTLEELKSSQGDFVLVGSKVSKIWKDMDRKDKKRRNEYPHSLISTSSNEFNERLDRIEANLEKDVLKKEKSNETDFRWGYIQDRIEIYLSLWISSQFLRYLNDEDSLYVSTIGTCFGVCFDRYKETVIAQK